MNLPNLKSARQKCSVKQEVIALNMCVTKSTVSKMESKCADELSLKKLSRYVSALGGTLCVEMTLPDGTTYEIG
jgi:DNA-binding XRE family transcriptional regulator